MTYITIQNVSTKKNNGDRAEENFDFAMNGFISGKDSLGYDVADDVTHNGIGYSVKSNHFSLASANLIKGETMTEKLNYYFETVHSTKAVYVTKDNIAYIMNMNEFREMLEAFGTLERESNKNGGGLKVRCKAESKKMRDWLAERAN